MFGLFLCGDSRGCIFCFCLCFSCRRFFCRGRWRCRSVSCGRFFDFVGVVEKYFYVVDMVYKFVKGGYLNVGSVGFKLMCWEINVSGGIDFFE